MKFTFLLKTKTYTGGGCLIWHRLYQLFLDLFYEGLENGFKTLQKEDRT